MLAKKMEIIAWTVQAMPMLLDQTINESLKVYRVFEIPLEPHLKNLYQNRVTGSTAILPVIETLSKFIKPITEQKS